VSLPLKQLLVLLLLLLLVLNANTGLWWDWA
jgi:hypothetical protein